MGVRRGIGALWALVAVACAGPEQGFLRPSAVDPGLAALDGDPGRLHPYAVVSIERYDGFLEEAARVEATVDLARRLGGELRAEVIRLAEEKGVERAEHRPWTALCRELIARDLAEEEREALRQIARPLAVLLPHLDAMSERLDRLLADGGELFDDPHRDLSYEESRRLARALDAVNVSVSRLRLARARLPVLIGELGLGLEELAAVEGLGPAPAREVRAYSRRSAAPAGDGS